MTVMKSGDKVVCIDATPMPMVAPRDCNLMEFSFPDGFLEEGKVYCIQDSIYKSDGFYSLFLVGKRIIFRGKVVGWCSDRFRKIEDQEIAQERVEVEMLDL